MVAAMSTPSTNQHAGGGPPATPAVPEPPFAERARTLMHLGRTGTLSTQLRKHTGFPFGSVAPYGLDAHGRPTFLISTMAMHTQNLLADPHASLLVTQPGWTEDPLAGARLTLVGTVSGVPAARSRAVRAPTTWRARRTRATGSTSTTSPSTAWTSRTCITSPDSARWAGSTPPPTALPRPIRSPITPPASSIT